MKKQFSIRQALSFGWDKMKENFWFFFGLVLITNGVSLILSSPDDPNKAGLYWGSMVLSFLVTTWFSAWQTTSQLKIYKGEKGSFKDLLDMGSLYLNYLGGLFLYSVVVFAGFVLLIVPGIIFAIKYQYVPFLIVDKKLNPIEAFGESSRITSGTKWRLFVFGIVTLLVTILGAIAFGIGLFVAIPVVLMAQVFIYKKLQEQTKPANMPAANAI